MAQSFKATLNVECWKQHTCVHCESDYRYVLRRNVTGQGNTKEKATENAQNLAMKAVSNDVDFHACPGCGVVQPDMVADVKSIYAFVAMGLGVVGIAVPLVIGLAHFVVISISVWIAVAMAAVTLVVVLLGALYNPNRNIESNRAVSEGKVASGLLSFKKSPSNVGGIDYEPPGSMGAYLALVVLALAAVALTAAPEALRMVNGWPVNESWYPGVVGPGDTSCLYFDRQIGSIKGMWSGSVQVEAAEPDVGHIAGETKNSNWGDTISGKSVSTVQNRMWTKLSIPKNESLAGKTLNLDITVHASYPREEQGGFVDARGEWNQKTAVQLASPGAGTLYNQLWWGGQVAALVMLLLAGGGGLLLANGLRGKANPAHVEPVADGGSEDEGPPQVGPPPKVM